MVGPLLNFVGLALAAVAAARLGGRRGTGRAGGVAPGVAARLHVGEAAAVRPTQDHRCLLAQIKGGTIGRLSLLPHHFPGPHSAGVESRENIAALQPLVGWQWRFLAVSRTLYALLLLHL